MRLRESLPGHSKMITLYLGVGVSLSAVDAAASSCLPSHEPLPSRYHANLANRIPSPYRSISGVATNIILRGSGVGVTTAATKNIRMKAYLQ
jgi:hypothetical protein